MITDFFGFETEPTLGKWPTWDNAGGPQRGLEANRGSRAPHNMMAFSTNLMRKLTPDEHSKSEWR